MSTHTKWLSLFLSSFVGILLLGHTSAYAGNITLYTPYTKISVPPGESINYTVDVINNGSGVQNVPISILGMPKGWDYSIKSGGWNISQIAVLPGKQNS